MPHTPEKLLCDMLAAGAAIATFFQGRTRHDYDSDLMFRSAVERQFEILGEALRRLEVLDSDVVQRITDHRRIIDFRNVIAHGYDAIDPDIVWQAVQDKLPLLVAEVSQLLIDVRHTP